jgi:hypothetical protein
MTDETGSDRPEEKRELSPAAQRALAEAEARRAEADRQAAERAREVGRKGPDPARYGDWEKNGIASDF